jgi:signal transduction histidine kinase
MFRFARVPWLLAGLYAVLGFALYLWVHRSAEERATALAGATAKLLAIELSHGLEALAIDEIEDLADRRSRFELYADVVRLVAGAELVESIEVVDVGGLVVVAEPAQSIGLQRQDPAIEFRDDRLPRVTSGARDGLSGYLVELPLVRNEHLFGSLRLTLARAPFDDLYQASRERLSRVAAVFFALFGVLGFALHWQVRRQREDLARTIGSALAGGVSEPPTPYDPFDPGDPFGPVVETASRLGLELIDARERSADLERGLGRLARLLEVGVLVIDAAGKARFVSPRARDLAGSGSLDQLVTDLHERIAGGERAFLALRGDTEIAVQVDRVEVGDYLVLLRQAGSARALEVDLRLAAQLRSMMHLYRGVAHDLRAPLNALVLNLELLRRSVVTPQPHDDHDRAAQQQWVAVLTEEIERLRRGLEALLAQASPPDREPVLLDVNVVLGQLETLLLPQAKQQDVSIELTRGAEVLLVKALPDQLKQAILNLAVNALEAMPDGGTLALSARGTDKRVLIAVRDTGGGVPEAVRERLFQMHTTTKSTGTGIGLYTAQAIVTAVGGAVRLAATSPEGTCFELDLPRVT